MVLALAANTGCGRALVGQQQATDAGTESDSGGPLLDAGDPCATPIDLHAEGEPIEGGLSYRGSTARAVSQLASSCGGAGPEAVFAFTPDTSGMLRARLLQEGTSFDTVLSVRTSCSDPDSELSCNDDSAGALVSTTRTRVTAGTELYIIVDGVGPMDLGTFVLEVVVTPEMDAGMPDGGMPDGGMADGGMADGGAADAGVGG